MQAILSASRAYSPENRLNVLVLGPGTDVASALLQDPSVENRIRVIAMAFDNYQTGSDGWNVANDIPAWQTILRSHTPIVVGDANVCIRDLQLERQQARDVMAPHGDAGRYLADLHTQWLDDNPKMCQDTTGSKDRWPVWDEVTTAFLLGLTQQETRPRPELQDGGGFKHIPGGLNGDNVTWITRVDAPALWSNFTHDVDATLTNPALTRART